jgi:predicted nucleic acid-binding protein
LKCVVDANILIDLNNGEILTRLFDLPLEIAASDAVLDELTEPDRNTLQHMGLGRMVLSPAQLVEAVQMHAGDPRLSLGDCTAFIAARDDNRLLLTGDKRLRDRAGALPLPTHGLLWILDEIEAAGLLSNSELAASLQKMLDEGARLPSDECEKRLQRWSGTE